MERLISTKRIKKNRLGVMMIVLPVSGIRISTRIVTEEADMVSLTMDAQ
jgi:hypothetical protein